MHTRVTFTITADYPAHMQPTFDALVAQTAYGPIRNLTVDHVFDLFESADNFSLSEVRTGI